MKETNILFESGDFWVGRVKSPKALTVYKTGEVYSTADSSYPDTEDGLSIAIARCKYLAKRSQINKD